MGAIFISYRRDDAEGQAGRLYDDLVGRFGANEVFMDVADIEAGRDFRQAIDQHVSSCGVLLALIGKDWIESRDTANKRRLDNPNDFVRLEIASALKRDIPVIPVLVRGADMPTVEQLPADCQDLCYRNGVELTHARWDSDVEVLIKALSVHVKKESAIKHSASAAISPASGVKAGKSRFVWGLSAGILVLSMAAAAIFLFSSRKNNHAIPLNQRPKLTANAPVNQASAMNEVRDKIYVCRLNPEGDNFLSLRSGPDGSYPEIVRLGANTILKVLQTQGPWYYVRMRNGTVGWVHSRWVCQGSP